jgi:hypothetical protein
VNSNCQTPVCCKRTGSSIRRLGAPPVEKALSKYVSREFIGGADSSLSPLSMFTCGELVYSAASSAQRRAIAAHRLNRIIVCCSRREVGHIHAVNHGRQILIPPIRRISLAIQFFWVRAVMHHRVLDQAAASVGRPSNNGGIIRRRFQCRSLNNLNSPGFLTNRPWLRISLG